jgi:hypothetical protein
MGFTISDIPIAIGLLIIIIGIIIFSIGLESNNIVKPIIGVSIILGGLVFTGACAYYL